MDAIEIFERSFEPHGDGYLYHPGKGGGRFVTKAEYEELRAYHRRWLDPRSWRFLTILTVFLVLLMMVMSQLNLSEDGKLVVIGVGVLPLIAYVFWVVCAPNRLVKDRPAIAPPKSAAERHRFARQIGDTRLGSLFTFGCAAVLIYCLAYPENTFRWWGWTLFCGAIVILSLVNAFQSWRDRRAERR